MKAKEVVHRDAVCVLRFPGGVDWDGDQVKLCVGIAAKGDGHVRLLAELAEILMDPDAAEALRETADEAEVRTASHGGNRMKVARFHAPGDIRVEDAPEPVAGPGELLIRVRNCSTCGTDAKILKFGHHHIRPPRVHGPRDRRRGRDRDGLVRARRPGADHRRHPVRRVRGVQAGPDDGLPQPGVDGLPLRRRLRRVHGRPREGPGRRRRQPHPRGRGLRRGVGRRAAGLRAERPGAGPGRPRRRRGGDRLGPDRLSARTPGARPGRQEGHPGRPEPRAAWRWRPSWSTPTPPCTATT